MGARLNRLLAEDAHLRLQMYAGGILNTPRDFCDEREDVPRGRAAEIDDESGMLFTYLRIAHAQAAQAAFVNKTGGKQALGPLECAACAGIFEGLLFAAGAGKRLHALA